MSLMDKFKGWFNKIDATVNMPPPPAEKDGPQPADGSMVGTESPASMEPASIGGVSSKPADPAPTSSMPPTQPPAGSNPPTAQ